MPNNVAGDLPEDQLLNFTLTIKKGMINDNPRGGESRRFRFMVSDGWLVLRARVQTEGNSTQPQLPNDFQIFFKRAKNATQSQFVMLNEGNFLDCLKARWSRITPLEMTRWEQDQMTAVDGTTFEVFIYKPRQARARVGTLRRATANAVRGALADVQALVANNPQHRNMGQIQQQHLAVHLARHPRAEGEEIQVPTDATTRQAAALDDERRALDAEEARVGEQRRAVLQPIRLELNGTMVTVRVDIASLRTALGLPQHNLFHEGIYGQGYQHPELAAEDDIDDLDHADDNDD